MEADKITLAEFKEKLGKYPALIQTLSKRPTKEGQLSLEELDQFRYVEAPSQFSKAGGKSLGLADIQKLVEWKIRHGKFRPTLPKLVASNKEENVTTILAEAFELYAKDPSDMKSIINKIAELKGVGPATASLILAIHDPEHVTFFSDECYGWLVDGGEIKYNVAEFVELHEKSKTLISKFGAAVTALDIEKVSFVIKKENEPVKEIKPKPGPTGKPRGRPKLAEHEKKALKPSSGRGRGRPKGPAKVAAPKTPNGTSKRGRPKKVKATTEDGEGEEPTQPTTPPKTTKRKTADEGDESNKKVKA